MATPSRTPPMRAEGRERDTATGACHAGTPGPRPPRAGRRRRERRPYGTGSLYLRGRVWWIQYRHNGKTITESSRQSDERAAGRLLRDRLRTAGTPRHVTPQTDRTTFDEVAALYLADYRQNQRASLNDAERHVRQLAEVFGGRWLAITEARIESYKADRLDAGEAKATINRRLAALRRMGRLGLRHKLVPSMPTVTLLDESGNVREGFVEPADFKALLALLPGDVADGTEFAYHSAWRRGMVFEHCRWSYVTLDWSEDHKEIVGGTIRLPGPLVKNRKPLTLPLRGRLLEIVRRRWAKRLAPCPFVFHADGEAIRRFRGAWEKACEEAGLPGLRFHDLRRSAARNMRRTGHSEHVIMKAAGWKTAAMFRRYDIVDEADLAQLHDDLAAFVEAQERQPGKAASLAAARTRRRKPAPAEAAVNLQ